MKANRIFPLRPIRVAGLVLLLIAAGGAEIAAASSGTPEVIDRIVAEVNDDAITLFELEQAARPFIERSRTMDGSAGQEHRLQYEIREKVLGQMIDQKLTDQEVKRLDISVSEETVDTTIEEIKKRNYMTDADLQEQIRSEGLTMEEYRQQVRDQILRGRLVNREVKSKIVITDEDIEACYIENEKEFCSEKKYHIRHIMAAVAPYADDAEKAEARERMEAVLAQLEKGASFEELARTRSDSPMKEQGGQIGAFELDDLALPIRQAVEKVEPGHYTPVVVTDQGYQIFFVESITEGKTREFEEARAEIEAQLYNEIVNEKFTEWLTELRQKSHIKIIR